MTWYNLFPPREPEKERRHSLWQSDMYEIERAFRYLDELARAERKDRRAQRIQRLLHAVGVRSDHEREHRLGRRKHVKPA